MVAGCGNKCVKYFFVFINFLFFVLGGVICALALWVRFDSAIKQRLGSVLNVNLDSLPIDNLYIVLYIIAALGLVLFFLGFFGCCGSCVESLCVISIYFIIVLALFAIEIAGGVYIIVSKDNIRYNFANAWRSELVYHYYDNTQIRNTLDGIQQSLQCCGAERCTDYSAIPASCQNCVSNPSKGCATTIFDSVAAQMPLVIAIAIVVLVVELVAMIFTCIICKAVREKRSSY